MARARKINPKQIAADNLRQLLRYFRAELEYTDEQIVNATEFVLNQEPDTSLTPKDA